MFKKLTIPFCAFALVIIFTSAVPVSTEKTLNPENVNKAFSDLKTYTLDGKLSFSELKNFSTTLKGEKLSFKEKVALKLFGKKISGKLEAMSPAASGEGKSQVVALLLVILVGGLGIHRFYLGYTWQGIVQLLTAGGCGIWWLIDLIRIATGGLQPKDGEYAKTL